MSFYQVRMATTQWHYKIIQADSKAEADGIAFQGEPDLTHWQDGGLGLSEYYDTVKIKE